MFPKTVFVNTGDEIRAMSAVEYDGKLWIVSKWLIDDTKRLRAPARLIRFDTLPHQYFPDGVPADFSVELPIPKNVLFSDALPQAQEQFEVLSQMIPLWFEIQDLQ